MPFGEVRIHNGTVKAYIEKPTYHYDVCSAISVLGPVALESLPRDTPTGISTLVQALVAGGKRVHAVPHSAPWIDVNDVDSIPCAEALVAAHQPDFDLWADTTGVCALRCDISNECIRLCADGSDCRKTLPRSAAQAAGFDLQMDDIDETGELKRYGITYIRDERPPGGGDGDWFPIASALMDERVTSIAKRALAFAKHVRENV
jgi:hypothetical protein